VLRVAELEQVELLADQPLLVREERELRAEPSPEGAVDVRRVDGDGGEPAVLALDLVLHCDEGVQAHLLLGAPLAAHEAEHQRMAVRDLV
jgi:hypothetical protein